MIDEKKHAPDIAFLRAVLAQEDDLTIEKIEEVVKQYLAEKASLTESFSPEDMVGYLESQLIDTHESTYYWGRFREYLETEVLLPASAIDALDGDSCKILDYAGNPQMVGEWIKRGMVIGHVQSGKTTNYSALICKAADAGYKLIVVLSGTSNLLRQQTQQRIDEAFIGHSTALNEQGIKIGAGVNSADDNDRVPVNGTSIDHDFDNEAKLRFSARMTNTNEPIIFVIKKNANMLANLKEWLSKAHPGGEIDYSLLLIDDEADNASINTKDPDDATRINNEIRDILRLFKRRSYIGYTATPFANIFIEPDSDDGMQKEDLFPHDFIMTLDAPDNYVGADKIFSDDNYSEKVNIAIDDHEGIPPLLPLKQKKDFNVKKLPASLKKAVRLFVLCRVLMRLKDGEDEHATMMVNVSRRTNVQEKVSELIEDYLKKVVEKICQNPNSGKHIADLKKDFESEYREIGISWENVRQHLDAAADIRVCTVNKNSEKLSYATSEKQRVIAVGGFALSRGFTLEGLRISYLIRNPGAYDTLMQMGRWFGYRDSYEEQCRVFMPKDLRELYAKVNAATNELRKEIEEMNREGLGPTEVGLKIRRHKVSEILITARNKMRNAENFKRAKFEEREVQTQAIYHDVQTNGDNYAYISEWVEGIGACRKAPSEIHANHLFWRGVPYGKVLEFMEKFRIPVEGNDPLTLKGRENFPTALATQYIEERREELEGWDVCVPLLRGEGKISFLGKGRKIRKRTKGKLSDDEKIYFISGGKGKRIASPDDDSIGLSKEQIKRAKHKRDENSSRSIGFNRIRKHPLLIIHLFKAFAKGDNAMIFNEDMPVIAYSICFPSSNISSGDGEYSVNRALQARLDFEPEYDDDDE